MPLCRDLVSPLRFERLSFAAATEGETTRLPVVEGTAWAHLQACVAEDPGQEHCSDSPHALSIAPVRLYSRPFVGLYTSASEALEAARRDFALSQPALSSEPSPIVVYEGEKHLLCAQLHWRPLHDLTLTPVLQQQQPALVFSPPSLRLQARSWPEPACWSVVATPSLAGRQDASEETKDGPTAELAVLITASSAGGLKEQEADFNSWAQLRWGGVADGAGRISFLVVKAPWREGAASRASASDVSWENLFGRSVSSLALQWRRSAVVLSVRSEEIKVSLDVRVATDRPQARSHRAASRRWVDFPALRLRGDCASVELGGADLGSVFIDLEEDLKESSKALSPAESSWRSVSFRLSLQQVALQTRRMLTHRIRCVFSASDSKGRPVKFLPSPDIDVILSACVAERNAEKAFVGKGAR